jgi:hypothetical protein
VHDLGQDLRLEPARLLFDEAKPEVDVTDEPALGRRQEERTAVELANATHVVKERGGEEEIRSEPLMKLSGLAAHGRHRDRVLEQTACPSVMAFDGCREDADAVAKAAVADETPDEHLQARVSDLRGQELEEAVELLDVTARLGNE